MRILTGRIIRPKIHSTTTLAVILKNRELPLQR